MSDKPRSGLAEVYRANSSAIPVTSVPTQEGVDRPRPNGGTDVVRYSTSVRDCANARTVLEAEKPKQPHQYTEADWNILAYQKRQRDREAEHLRNFIVTIDPVTGIKTTVPRR